jgi:hypothetical protein
LTPPNGTDEIAAKEKVELIATIPQCNCEAIFLP